MVFLCFVCLYIYTHICVYGFRSVCENGVEVLCTCKYLPHSRGMPYVSVTVRRSAWVKDFEQCVICTLCEHVRVCIYECIFMRAGVWAQCVRAVTPMRSPCCQQAPLCHQYPWVEAAGLIEKHGLVRWEQLASILLH